MPNEALMMARPDQNVGKKNNLNFISVLFNSGFKYKPTFLTEFKIKNNMNISLLTKTK